MKRTPKERAAALIDALLSAERGRYDFRPGTPSDELAQTRFHRRRAHLIRLLAQSATRPKQTRRAAAPGNYWPNGGDSLA